MLASKRIHGADDAGALFTQMVKLGITDGLPVIPPTERSVRYRDCRRLPNQAYRDLRRASGMAFSRPLQRPPPRSQH